MSRKTPTVPAAPSLAEQAAEIAFRQAGARTLLRTFLADGISTAAVRGELADLDRQAADIDRRIAAEVDAVQEALEGRLMARAADLAAGSANRLSALLAALQPPAPPWTVR